MNRKFVFTPGQIYHLYNWGTDQREIFSDINDYNRFLRLLYLCNSDRPLNFNYLATTSLRQLFQSNRGEPLVAIGAYCLLPNHFHLVVKEITPKGISKFMSRLATAYSMYYNYKYGRRGKLYEGPFKARLMVNDKALESLVAYVHTRPVGLDKSSTGQWQNNRVVTADYLRSYIFSSLPDYLREARPQKTILDLRHFKVVKTKVSVKSLMTLVESSRATS